MPKAKWSIVFVDDELSEVGGLARACKRHCNVIERTFEDLTLRDIQRADLLLVDFSIQAWPAIHAIQTMTLAPKDGLAVIEIIKSLYREKTLKKPIAFAVLTGDLEKLTNPFPPSRREHMVADITKLEWAFQKATPQSQLVTQITDLAAAISSLPSTWPYSSNTKKDKVLKELLNLDSKASWAPSARADVSRCHPPIQELSAWSHGLAFVRWVLHRILPYPTFLLDDAQVALRLGVTKESFCAAIGKSSGLRRLLEPVRYSGILADFKGARWWRAGIDSVLWELSKDDPYSRSALKRALGRKFPTAVYLDLMNPVPCVNEQYEFTNFAEASKCVRLRPDDWPSYAEDAWAEKAVIANSEPLLMMVEEDDRASLKEIASE